MFKTLSMGRRLSSVAIAVSALLIPSISGCGTSSLDMTVTRAPTVPVYKARQIVLAAVEVTGSTVYETEFACGGKAEGELAAIPEARRSYYANTLQALARSVLQQNGVVVVGVGMAQQTLRLAAKVVEIQATTFKRCDQKNSLQGLNCLPDPVASGKSQCGCVAVKEGSLNPEAYHFAVDAEGNLRIEVNARLESADGHLIAEDTIHLLVPPSSTAGAIPCNHVQGQPKFLERCLNAVATLSSGAALQEVTPDYDTAFKATYLAVTAQENGGRKLREAMFPFQASVRYTVFDITEPETVAEPAVEALKARRFDQSVAAFERGLSTVRRGVGLSAEARARFLYDYGVSLVGVGKLREARAAIQEATAIRPDEQFDAALREIERQTQDTGAVGTDHAQQP